jgi:nucleoside-diphosphate-sugar epimerase
LLSMDKLHGLGWKHQIELEDGIKRVYKNILDNQFFL